MTSNRLAVLADKIRTAHDDVCRSAKYSAEQAVEAGRWLAEAKADENIPRGGWERWVEEVAGVPPSTARHYISLFDAIREQTLTLADITEAGQIGALKEATREVLRREQAAKVYDPPIIPPGKFGTIVVDPPWDMEKIERDVAPNQVGFDYPTMTEDELAVWPVVQNKAAEDCHLFCWTTEKWLQPALRLVEVWGFRYCMTLVWRKAGGFQPFGLPQFNCEFVVYGRRGAPKFCETTDFMACFDGARREHSRKPAEFYATLRRVTTDPRIDLFSREQHEGFAQFGNEVEKFA